MKQKIISISITGIVGLLFYYFLLPPLNFGSPLFWLYFFVLIVLFLFLNSFESIEIYVKNKRILSKNNKLINYTLIALGGIVLVICFLNLIVSPLFNANSYHNRIMVDETHQFTADVKEVDFNKIPLLDKDSSMKLGDRKMGQATDWVSQYYVSDLYTQINYNDHIIRVTPIEYAGFIKYLSNHKTGIKGYITVDSVTGDANLVKLEKGIKYLPSAYFNEDLNRKLRFSYPTEIFDEANFELDNEGNPFWIIPTLKYTMVGMKKEVSGVIIFDAQTGKSQKYALKDIPTWVDHVYNADLIIEQLNDWGNYQNGFINAYLGQKNVVNTTEGYNYLVMDNDVYLYTGITSVSTDESNLGFVLVNMRTKETNYYNVPGAEEYSAMASAEGLVQEKGYEASFPLLINLNNRPTYLLSLKDAAGLVKMYAFVDVADYQKVIVSDSSLGIASAAQKYLKEIPLEVNQDDVLTKEVTVNNLTSVVIDGNTNYFFKDDEDNVYNGSIKINSSLFPFLKNGDKVKITYTNGLVKQIINIEK